MNVLFMDVETTGLFNYSKRAHEDGQPRMCSLAALLVDGETGGEKSVLNVLVKPDGWTNDAEHINGLSMARLEADGIPVGEVLTFFDDMLNRADVVCGFNVDFDLKMHRGECRRDGRPDRYGDVPKVCVMFGAAQAINKQRRIKLAAAVEALLDRPHAGAHTAMADCQAARDLYFELKRRGQLPSPIRDVPKADGPAPAAAPATPAAPTVVPAPAGDDELF